LLLVDPPSASVDETIGLAQTLAASGSANGAIYFPPLLGGPLSGAVAGVFARADESRGVWKAPAGLDAVLC
jgi:phage tail sheath protein FI